MSKNLKYFMREAAEVERVVTVPAPESFKDENGKGHPARGQGTVL